MGIRGAERRRAAVPAGHYPPSRLSNGNVALIGNTGAVARPYTAMGAAKAAGDALALASLLDQLPVPQALARFNAVRLPVSRQTAAYGVRLGGSPSL